eukprot:11300050-Alexandrium_andersonii.AAC.1
MKQEVAQHPKNSELRTPNPKRKFPSLEMTFSPLVASFCCAGVGGTCGAAASTASTSAMLAGILPPAPCAS